MKIVAFDIGIKNLAFCILETINENIFDAKIKKWEVINLKDDMETSKHLNLVNINKKIIEVLDSFPELLDVDYVGLENQPCLKNPTMKTIQIMVFSYFIMRGIQNTNSKIKNIIMINAREKSKICPINCDEYIKEISHLKSNYSKRKKLSIYQCGKMIDNESNKNQLDFYKSNKKKDDLSDCFLLAMILLKKYDLSNSN